MKEKLQQELIKLEQQVAEIRKAIEAEEAKEWPKIGDKYYTIIRGGIADPTTYRDDKIDQYLLSIGNVHRTSEDAEKWLERKQLEHKMDEGGTVRVYLENDGNWYWIVDTISSYGRFKTAGDAQTFLSDQKNIELLNKHFNP